MELIHEGCIQVDDDDDYLKWLENWMDQNNGGCTDESL